MDTRKSDNGDESQGSVDIIIRQLKIYGNNLVTYMVEVKGL